MMLAIDLFACLSFVTLSSLAPVGRIVLKTGTLYLLFIDVFIGKNNSTWNSAGAQFLVIILWATE